MGLASNRDQIWVQSYDLLNKPKWTQFRVGLCPQGPNLGWVGLVWSGSFSRTTNDILQLKDIKTILGSSKIHVHCLPVMVDFVLRIQNESLMPLLNNFFDVDLDFWHPYQPLWICSLYFTYLFSTYLCVHLTGILVLIYFCVIKLDLGSVKISINYLDQILIN